MRKIGTIFVLLLITFQFFSTQDHNEYQDLVTEIVILGDDELIEGEH